MNCLRQPRESLQPRRVAFIRAGVPARPGEPAPKLRIAHRPPIRISPDFVSAHDALPG